MNAHASLDAELSRLRNELDRVTEERDYWKDQAEERASTDQWVKLRVALQLAPAEAAVLAAMYVRGGRVLRKFEIDDVVPPTDHVVERDTNIITVWVCRLRKKLGEESIRLVRGEGYCLTPIGIDRTRTALGAFA
jgi:DNA-binding response OmpR family regulator